MKLLLPKAEGPEPNHCGQDHFLKQDECPVRITFCGKASVGRWMAQSRNNMSVYERGTAPELAEDSLKLERNSCNESNRKPPL